MNESDRQRLTEYLEEKWVRANWKDGLSVPFMRTFTTPADLYAVFSKMVEKGKWSYFRLYADGKRTKEAWGHTGIADLDVWLFCLNTPDQIDGRLTMAAEWISRARRPDGCLCGTDRSLCAIHPQT